MKYKKRNRNLTGLKRFTHVQRTKILKERLVPILKEKLGKNLIAIAADGSYARNQDTDFSDIELIIFVEEKKDLPYGFSRILDGILVEGIFLTEKEYYKTTIEPNEYWFASGSDVLKALTNTRFINRIKKYRVKNLKSKCMNHARSMLPEIQENFGKIFTAIEQDNRENVFPMLGYCVLSVLKMMSFINLTPYTTLGTFITQSKNFKIKPRGYDQFIACMIEGKYTDLLVLDKHITVLYQGIEDFFGKKSGAKIYDADLTTILDKI